jgi:hypothetical protein
MLYKVTGVWGNHEGSMLLWVLILTLFYVLVLMSGWLALGVAGQFLLFSLSESIALQQNAIVWVTYVAVAAKTALSLQSTREPEPEYRAPRQETSALGAQTGVVRRPGIVRVQEDRL